MTSGQSNNITDFTAAELPQILWIELSSKCPFDCVFCSRRLRRGAGEHLDFELYRALIRSLRDPRIIRLDYAGESIEYPLLLEAIELAKDAGARVELVSALTTASDSLLHGLVASGLDRLAVSLHTMRQDQYQQIYGAGSLAEVRKRIAELIAIKRNLGSQSPRLEFAFVAMKANLAQLPSVASYARECGAEISVHPVTRRDPIPSEFREELEAGKLRESFKEELRQAVLLARHIAKGVQIKVCSPEMEPGHALGPLPGGFAAALPPGAMIRSCDQNPWETVHILADGSVVLCEVQDRVVLGNLHRESLEEIWRGAEYRNLRRKYVIGGLAECVGCPRKVAHLPSAFQPRVSVREGASPQLFRGWYERDGSGTLWSKQEAVVILAAEVPPGQVRLAGALPPSTDGAFNELQVTCDGVMLGKIVNPTRARISFDVCLGGLPRAEGPLTFVLKTRTTFKPAQAGIEGDLRNVGFALYRMELA